MCARYHCRSNTAPPPLPPRKGPSLLSQLALLAIGLLACLAMPLIPKDLDNGD